MCRWSSLNVCVSFFVNWLFQTQLSASRHDGHLVFHVETHQMTDTQKQLIAGPRLLAGKHRQTELNRVDSCTPRVCSYESQAQQLYLSVCINQQQVAHCASFHATEYIVTRGWAALSDQEISTTGEEGLCLLST